MSLKDFKKIGITDFDTRKLQENTAEYIAQLTSNPLLSGRIIEGIDVSTTAVDIAHGLGREPLGYFIVKASAQVTVFDSTSTTPKVTLKLTGSATATINIYVF